MNKHQHSRGLEKPLLKKWEPAGQFFGAGENGALAVSEQRLRVYSTYRGERER